LHNVSGILLNMASQQVSAATFNCPMLECTRRADELPWAVKNPLVIKDGYMAVSMEPGLGVELDQAYLKANLAEGEPWWGD
jgi:galactonate dehydratase